MVRLLSSMLALSLLFGCAGFRNLNLLSTEDEVALGAQFDTELSKELTFIEDAEIVRYVEDLTARLAKVCKRPDLTYHVKVAATEEMNAFAVPGGYLYVNLGLIRAARNEAELAGVMAHEIGHVVARHGAKALTKQLGLAAVVELVTGDDPTTSRKVLATLIALGGQGLMLKYSREDESEADALAVQNLYDAGIDPNGLVYFFTTLLEEGGEIPKAFEVFSTHPNTRQRIRDAQERIRALPPRPNLRKDDPAFQRIKKRLPPPKSSPSDKTK